MTGLAGMPRTALCGPHADRTTGDLCTTGADDLPVPVVGDRGYTAGKVRRPDFRCDGSAVVDGARHLCTCRCHGLPDTPTHRVYDAPNPAGW